MQPSEASVARKGAILVKWGFEKYRSGYRRITRRLPVHFEVADWHGVQHDMVERLTLYSTVVRRVVTELEGVFGTAGRDEELWAEMKAEYAGLDERPPRFRAGGDLLYSVTRKIFTTVGVHAEREFVCPASLDEDEPAAVPVRSYPGTLRASPLGQQILDDYAFAVPYADYEGDAKLIGLEIDKAVSAPGRGAPPPSTSFSCSSPSSSATRGLTWSAGWCAATASCRSSSRSTAT